MTWDGDGLRCTKGCGVVGGKDELGFYRGRRDFRGKHLYLTWRMSKMKLPWCSQASRPWQSGEIIAFFGVKWACKDHVIPQAIVSSGNSSRSDPPRQIVLLS